jgi:hypothetical protein
VLLLEAEDHVPWNGRAYLAPIEVWPEDYNVISTATSNDVVVVEAGGNGSGAQFALEKSSRELPGAKALLLSPERPTSLPAEINHESIAPLGYFEYGLFILYALHNFISTKFALIVQEDGWVLSGSAWRDEFFRYDYIGAPIHLARVRSRDKSRYVRGFQWTEYLGQRSVRIDHVLNGGFSLRSARLLRAPSKYKIPYTLPSPDQMVGPPYRLEWESDAQYEDVYLCLNMRRVLVEQDMIFASLEVAKHFSIEHLNPRLHAGFDLMTVFGHHSRIRKFSSLEPLKIAYQMGRGQMSNVIGEETVARVFRQRGYEISFK